MTQNPTPTALRRLALSGLALALLAGCASRGDQAPRLMNITQRGPDEFSILPTQPLQAPPDFVTLPPPTPGAPNRVDIDPRAEAVRALGGRPQAHTGALPAADAAILNRAAQFGTSDDIRQTLAAEDLRLRQRGAGRPLERLFRTNVYARAYEDQLLDREAELRRWQRAGARTPAAPPPDSR
jgi:hypothetical protein